MTRSHPIHTWSIIAAVATVIGAITTPVRAVEPAPGPVCDDACMDEVETFCSIPEITPYDQIGDCVADIVAGTVPDSFVPSAPPFPAVSGDVEQETLELDL